MLALPSLLYHTSPEKVILIFIKHKLEQSHSINSIAIQVNQTGNIYPENLQEIRQGLDEIQSKLAEYQAKLERFALRRTEKPLRAVCDDNGEYPSEKK